MIRFRYFLFIFYLTALSSASFGEDVGDFFYLAWKEDWAGCLALVDRMNAEDPDRDSLLGLWYMARLNPEQDADKATFHLEEGARKGSFLAKQFLIGRYLLVDNPRLLDFKKGAGLAEEMYPFMLNEIQEGRDPGGEISMFLGYFYVYGIAVDKDIERGRRYLREAVDAGNKNAKPLLSFIGEK